jgi:hypothetical protein
MRKAKEDKQALCLPLCSPASAFSFPSKIAEFVAALDFRPFNLLRLVFPPGQSIAPRRSRSRDISYGHSLPGVDDTALMSCSVHLRMGRSRSGEGGIAKDE